MYGLTTRMSTAGVLVALTSLVGQSSAQSWTFTDVTATSGINHLQHTLVSGEEQQAYYSGSASCGDFNNDGWVDLFVTRYGHADIMYFNNGDGTFTDATTTAFGPTPLVANTNGAQAADIDNDGDLDIYVTAIDVNHYYLFINDGTGVFTEEAAARGADLFGIDRHFGYSIGFGDYDLDGYLDFYTTEWRFDSQNLTGAPQNSKLYRNQGAANPGHFTDVTLATGTFLDLVLSNNPAVFDSMSFAPRFTDLDRDGHPDLIIAGDHQTSRLFWNNGDGTFTDGTDAANVGTDTFGMGSAVGDYDGDGDLDWFVTSINDDSGLRPLRDGNRLYRYDGNRIFTDVTDAAGVRDGDWGWAAAFSDFDNDGDLDLMHTNGIDFAPPHYNEASHGGYDVDPTIFWSNDGTGVFTEETTLRGVTDTASGKGLLTFDYDKDGDLDVFITNSGDQPVLYRNDGGNDNNWLRIETQGTVSNREGIHAFITVTPDSAMPSKKLVHEIDGGSNFLSHNERTAHFGLGTDTEADVVMIEWPSGIVQVLRDVPANSVIQVVEPPCIGYLADVNGDGAVTPTDFTAWINAYNSNLPECDQNLDGVCSPTDFSAWINNFNAGC
ncbi:MAG: CRTAC1 family protein [Phycisphaera sp.]|nr:MAG: CRTAC1 family protein [Phycisphaera sp.]